MLLMWESVLDYILVICFLILFVCLYGSFLEYLFNSIPTSIKFSANISVLRKHSFEHCIHIWLMTWISFQSEKLLLWMEMPEIPSIVYRNKMKTWVFLFSIYFINSTFKYFPYKTKWEEFPLKSSKRFQSKFMLSMKWYDKYKHYMAKQNHSAFIKSW